MTTRNKRKLAALNKENCEERPSSNLAQTSSARRSQEDYITQISGEIEGRVTKRLSKEFSRTENRILGALARLDDFLMNPLLPGHSGTTPELSRNALNTRQGTNEDDSQNDPRPEAGLFHGQMTQSSGPEERHDSPPINLWFDYHLVEQKFNDRLKQAKTTKEFWVFQDLGFWRASFLLLGFHRLSVLDFFFQRSSECAKACILRCFHQAVSGKPFWNTSTD